MLVDTHCHLYVKDFEADIEEVMERTFKSGVRQCYLPAIDSETHDATIALETKYPGKCFAMMGLHPCSVKENYLDELANVQQRVAERKFAAIGETGLDFYWDKTFVNEQYKTLEIQIELALQYQLPIVLHTRNATQETIDIIKKYSSRGLSGIFHCFGGTIEEAKQVTDLGFYLGIGGVVTYKNSGIDTIVKEIDLKHIVLETDAPYLSPVPYRGKRNESSYLYLIAEKIALLKGTSVEEIALVTGRNAELVFGKGMVNG